MAEHTPGPLEIGKAEIDSDGGFDWAIIATIDGQRVILAECYEVVAPGVKVPAEANARLYATAPELLAACQAALEALRYIEAQALPEFERGWNEEIHALKAAIAKATAEE